MLVLTWWQKPAEGEGKGKCCEVKAEEQQVGTSSGPSKSPVSAGSPGMAELSLGLVFGDGGEELIFPWSFPRPILHFEV